MLHGMHTIFPPPSITNHSGHDPIAESKLQKKEGLWALYKEVLGWMLDGLHRTIALPDDKYERILVELRRAIRAKAFPLKQFQELVGKLRHAALAIPASRGLF